VSAYGTILAAIDGLIPSMEVTADTVRQATEAAQLRSAEIAGALRAACHDGYLAPLSIHLPDGTVGAVHVKSTHGPAKGRWVMVYRRTGKTIPEHVCEVAG
jgi:hypothetical protein